MFLSGNLRYGWNEDISHVDAKMVLMSVIITDVEQTSFTLAR